MLGEAPGVVWPWHVHGEVELLLVLITAAIRCSALVEKGSVAGTAVSVAGSIKAPLCVNHFNPIH